MVSVLVPGAGLGRLMLEVCAAGYTVEGNELSQHQLLASNWILNRQPLAEKHELYPWALSFSNHVSRANQMQKVMIPDVAPGPMLTQASENIKSEVHPYERMSMTAGDFCALYKGTEYAEKFDAVLTCFFIDTAPNVISYVDTVRHCLRPGGVWINLGPLLWHFEGNRSVSREDDRVKEHEGELLGIAEPGSVELTDEEVISLLQVRGFEVVDHDNKSHQVGYIQPPKSMLQNLYRPSFWVAERT